MHTLSMRVGPPRRAGKSLKPDRVPITVKSLESSSRGSLGPWRAQVLMHRLVSGGLTHEGVALGRVAGVAVLVHRCAAPKEAAASKDAPAAAPR